jgi:hypothetical protein
MWMAHPEVSSGKEKTLRRKENALSSEKWSLNLKRQVA